jgi:hypothetical protein
LRGDLHVATNVELALLALVRVSYFPEPEGWCRFDITADSSEPFDARAFARAIAGVDEEVAA